MPRQCHISTLPSFEWIEYGPPGPPPRRHYTEHGRWFWLYVIVGAALLLLTLLMCVPSRFGPVGW